MENNFGELWNLAETAEVMRVSQSTIVALTEGHPHDALPFVSHDGALYFDAYDIARWLEVTAANARKSKA